MLASMLIRLAALVLLAISPVLANDPIELYPIDNGRMYSVARANLYSSVIAVLEMKGLAVEAEDRGVIRTKPKWFKKKAMEAINGERVSAKVTFHIFVPPSDDLSRLYVNSVVEAGLVTYFNYDGLEAWILDAVDAELGAPSMGIPLDVTQRSAAIAEMSDNRCLVGLDGPIAEPTTKPVLIDASRIEPHFPTSLRQQREDAEIEFEVTLAEDGAVHSVRILDRTSTDPEAAASAVGAVRIWRYTPARSGECAVPVTFKSWVGYFVGSRPPRRGLR